MTPAQQAEINITLNPHQFLEYLLFSIKGVARKYGQKRKANLVREKESAQEKLKALTKAHDGLLEQIRSGPKCGHTEEAFIGVKDVLNVLQKKYLTLTRISAKVPISGVVPGGNASRRHPPRCSSSRRSGAASRGSLGSSRLTERSLTK